jgi:hypothetical protein
MTKTEAIKIWSLGPNGTEIPVIAEVPSPFSKQAKTPAKKVAKKAAKRKPEQTQDGNVA